MKAIKSIWNFFSLYEKIWFSSIMVLSIVISILFPEEDFRGINGRVIALLYFLDILFNITCELLISKQSKWNFIVSLLVEVTEIVTLLLLAYRFATIAVTIFFWIPIDIISFINWNKHKDRDDKEVTEVRKLTARQDVLVIIGIIVWTVVVGYLMTFIEVGGLLAQNGLLAKVVCYLDACVSAVGIANGLFILFRYREQWIAWYICSILETVINIISGQWVLLVLKAGYLTNTTYGYIRWTRYIRKHDDKDKALTGGDAVEAIPES